MKNIKQKLCLILAGITALAIGFFAGLASSDFRNTDNTFLKAAKQEKNTSTQTLLTECHSYDCKNNKEKLILAELKIEKLQQENNYLTSLAENNNLHLLEPANYSEVIDKIDNLPEYLLSHQLSKIISEESLNDIENIRPFSKRLAEIALNSQEELDDIGYINIIFSTSPSYGKKLLSGGNSIRANDTVFAHIVSSGISEEVIVKWQHLPTNEILLFKNKTISESNSVPSIWLRPRNGWKEGAYRVSVYTMDDEANPIGSNSYIIDTVETNPDNNPSDEIVQELLNSGKAIKKN